MPPTDTTGDGWPEAATYVPLREPEGLKGAAKSTLPTIFHSHSSSWNIQVIFFLST